MDELLKKIYYDYYNLERTLDFDFDKDFFKFVYQLKNYKGKTINIDKVLNDYKDSTTAEIHEQLFQNGKIDTFFAEKLSVHLTYPLKYTIKRLNIIFNTIGKDEWYKIFGFTSKNFISLINFILIRIILYNNYIIENNSEMKKQYEINFPLSTNYYFTKEELYGFFSENKKDIDKILKIISKNIFDFKNENDVFYFIEYNKKYILYFIWDFIYNLYDVIENYILDFYQNNKIDKETFYSNRGKVFENCCADRIKELFSPQTVYQNLYYNNNNGDHEIDILVNTQHEIIVFECKSSKFDIHKTKNDKELKNDFLRAFGNGFKTFNNLNNYINNGGNKFYSKNLNKSFNFDFQTKKVIFINISLHNIEYLQTSIQKIDKNLIKPVSVYPICWNYIDFLTITELGKKNIPLFTEYLYKRFDMINKNKNLTLDIDEIDVLGFLTDEHNDELYHNLINMYKENIDMNFMINNGAYRETVNNYLDCLFFEELIAEEFYND